MQVQVWLQLLALAACCSALRAPGRVRGFASSARERRTVLRVSLEELERTGKPIIIEFVSRPSPQQQQQQQQQLEQQQQVQQQQPEAGLQQRKAAEQQEARVVSAYTVYKEADAGGGGSRMVNMVTDSPAYRLLGFVFNPTSLLLVMYFSSIGWNQVLWVQKFFKIFGRGTLSKKEGDKGYVTPVEELPFQTFECEKCGMEMRPARGRAEAIFGRERFRCSRCGSKASAYFNVDDLNDPRAVARLERLKREKDDAANGVGLGDGDDDEDDEGGDESGDGEEEDGDDEGSAPPPPPPTRRPTKKF